MYVRTSLYIFIAEAKIEVNDMDLQLFYNRITCKTLCNILKLMYYRVRVLSSEIHMTLFYLSRSTFLNPRTQKNSGSGHTKYIMRAFQKIEIINDVHHRSN